MEKEQIGTRFTVNIEELDHESEGFNNSRINSLLDVINHMMKSVNENDKGYKLKFVQDYCTLDEFIQENEISLSEIKFEDNIPDDHKPAFVKFQLMITHKNLNHKFMVYNGHAPVYHSKDLMIPEKRDSKFFIDLLGINRYGFNLRFLIITITQRNLLGECMNFDQGHRCSPWLLPPPTQGPPPTMKTVS